MKMLLSLFFVVNLSAQAEVSVLFHPFDPTLEAIATRIENAKDTIDIAMYNIDTTLENPVIAKIASSEVQQRIQSGDLQIRMIFEGYSSPEANENKMKTLEDLGIDVRHLNQPQKVHHKFAVIDFGHDSATLISGSANWSLSSRSNYNENIFFFDQEPGITFRFHDHFRFLWDMAKEFGNSNSTEVPTPFVVDTEPGLNVSFNIANFKVAGGKLIKDQSHQGFTLTREIVDKIDSAETHIQIATTRIKLRPIYDALVRAARRGVQVDIVVTMGEYESVYSRKNHRVSNCRDVFSANCSAGKNFSTFLAREDFAGHENIDVRFKFFDLNLREYLSKQMHSKYIIIDDRTVLSGSFNWSYSAEYNHLENLVEVDGSRFPKVLKSFGDDFDRLFAMNRQNFMPYVTGLEEAIKSSQSVQCKFEPMTLEMKEIDFMLAAPRRIGKSLRGICY